MDPFAQDCLDEALGLDTEPGEPDDRQKVIAGQPMIGAGDAAQRLDIQMRRACFICTRKVVAFNGP